MELKNIFKMEMFKNRNDKPYLVVIAILTVMAAVASVWGVLLINADFKMSMQYVFLILLVVFTVIGLLVFSLLYPFHLLNVDYKNKVMSLIFASGVSREKYYFVKISATILTSLIATFVILLIPIVTFLIVYPDIFVDLVKVMIDSFEVSNIIPLVLSSAIGLIANLVMLTTAVIITKGKTSGIFLYFAFLFIISILQSSFLPNYLTNIVSGSTAISEYFYINAVLSIVETVAFVLIGLYVLRKQYL